MVFVGRFRPALGPDNLYMVFLSCDRAPWPEGDYQENLRLRTSNNSNRTAQE